MVKNAQLLPPSTAAGVYIQELLLKNYFNYRIESVIKINEEESGLKYQVVI